MGFLKLSVGFLEVKKVWESQKTSYLFILQHCESIDPAWVVLYTRSHLSSISHKIDMKTLDTKDEIWHKMYV